MYLSMNHISFQAIVAVIVHRPSRRLMIPRMPAIAETRRLPSILSLLIRMSPVGRSTTSVGAEGVDGDEKAEVVAEA